MTLGRSSFAIGSQLILVGLSGAYGATTQTSADLSVDEIVHRMVTSEERQKKNLQRYRAVREYRLRNADGSKTVEVLANISYNSQGHKNIQVVREQGAEGMFRRAIRKVLETEMKASRETKGEVQITPDNYDFRLAGVGDCGGARCYAIDLMPKRNSKFLINGRMWVDAEDFAIARIRGVPAANISFWVGKPQIEQSFQKVGDVWLLARNQSLTKAKMIGNVTFTMETIQVESGGAKLALKYTPRRFGPISD